MKVLVATDGSEPARRACERAVTLLHDDVETRVLTVLSYTAFPYALFPGGELSDEAARVQHAEEAEETNTRDARLIFEKAGFAVSVKGRFGNPADEILAEIDEWSPDLLVMGRRGVRGLERIIGSVSEHVVRRANISILLVP